jgi:hypothetical protein
METEKKPLSKREMLEHAREAGYTAKEFSEWCRAIGYSRKMVSVLVANYMENYQREGTSKRS